MVHDVTEAVWDEQVIERSGTLPVVVDFWAAWCGPCRTLGPTLEKAAAAREGKIELAKVDVDSNQGLARKFRVQGIPAVKAFRDGRVVDEFTGALPAPQVESFFDRLLPSEADTLAREGDEDALRRALELDPSHVEAARALARMLLRRGENEEALAVLAPVEGDFLAAGLAARARLAQRDGGSTAAFEAWDEGDHAQALEQLQAQLAASGDSEARDLIRRVMIGIFTELGPDDALAREHRRRLSSALN